MRSLTQYCSLPKLSLPYSSLSRKMVGVWSHKTQPEWPLMQQQHRALSESAFLHPDNMASLTPLSVIPYIRGYHSDLAVSNICGFSVPTNHFKALSYLAVDMFLTETSFLMGTCFCLHESTLSFVAIPLGSQYCDNIYHTVPFHYFRMKWWWWRGLRRCYGWN